MSQAPSRSCSRVMRRGRIDLRQQARGAQDRSGDEVREEGDEHREVEEVARRRDLAAVHVDDVAHRHERVERDADRQQDAQREDVDLPPERGEHVVQVVGEEVEVLEEPEQRQVEPEADDEERPPALAAWRRAPARARR